MKVVHGQAVVHWDCPACEADNWYSERISERFEDKCRKCKKHYTITTFI